MAPEDEKELSRNEPDYPILKHCRGIVQLANEEASRAISEWSTRLEPWDRIVEAVRSYSGNAWVLCCLANLASAIQSTYKARGFEELFDGEKPLCHRVRYARLRAGSVSWWRKQLGEVSNEFETRLALLVLLSWGSGQTLARLADGVDSLLKQLTPLGWQAVFDGIEQTVRLTSHYGMSEFNRKVGSISRNSISPRTVAALSLRFRSIEAKAGLFDAFLKHRKLDDPLVLKTVRTAYLSRLQELFSKGRVDTNAISRWYSERRRVTTGTFIDQGLYGSYVYYQDWPRIPNRAARTILRQPAKFPMYMIHIADSQAIAQVEKRLVPVADVISQRGWQV